MSIKIIKQGKFNWVNIDKVDDEAFAYLKSNYNFHHLDLEDLSTEQQSPKIDSYEDYLFIILQFPQWSSQSQSIIAHEIDIFIGQDFLITVQHTKSKELKNFFYRCMNNPKVKADWMSGSSGFLLYSLIEALFHQTHPLMSKLSKDILIVEQNIFNDEQDRHIVKNLAIIRRNVLNFRRIIDPQKYLTATLSHTRRPFIEDGLSLYFDNVTDYLNKIWAMSSTYRDTVSGLHVTVESLINQRTNKVISALTVISVSLLPLTLLSGIYGMNIIGLPWAREPHWVWMVFALLSIFIISIIVYMRKKKWI
jgi:magnesium transporter